jgi:hypothetical protein
MKKIKFTLLCIVLSSSIASTVAFAGPVFKPPPVAFQNS